jgi:hypothetical protein|tara:strand:+ start:7342 stop:7566 length:225 start_codon:yes stop_codon:yes gene_type:complete
MDKNVQLMIVGTILALASSGLVWMVATLIVVDKRTEVMNVKIDHVVQAIDEITRRKVVYDQPGTRNFSSIQREK